MRNIYHYLVMSCYALNSLSYGEQSNAIITQNDQFTQNRNPQKEKQTGTDKAAETICNLKLSFLEQHDERNKLPQIRNKAREIISLAPRQDTAQKQQDLFKLERELSLLMVVYCKDMKPEAVEKLSQLSRKCRDAIHALPDELSSKWRQTDIYRIFLAS